MAVIFSAIFTTPAAAHDPVEARHLANEGVMVVHGETKVLFDAFFNDGFGAYLTVPEETRAALLAGAAPYDGIDAVFISHVHGDHFSPEPLIAYLRAQPAVRVFAPVQIMAPLETALGGDAFLLERIAFMDLEPGDRPVGQRIDDALRADAVAVPHSGNWPDIQNLVWRVTLDGAFTAAHFGDAHPKAENFALHQAHWDLTPIDVAFPPYWFFRTEEGRNILDLIIRPKRAIGVHLPAEAQGKGEVWRAGLEADLFTDPGEVRALDHE